MARTAARPGVSYLAAVHSRAHFCQSAALVELRHGLGRITLRSPNPPGTADCDCGIFLDTALLARALIPGCGTCAAYLWAGYGQGLMGEQACLDARDRLNGPYPGLRQAVANMTPLLGLLASGLYLVADFLLCPVWRHGQTPEHFWDAPAYGPPLKFTHHYRGGQPDRYNVPMYLYPTQRASGMDPARVDAYARRLAEGDAYPRAIALYLSGAVSLLLDGHHKAAAAAVAGQLVRTLVIFPLSDPKAVRASAAAERLYLCQHKAWTPGVVASAGPLGLQNGKAASLGDVACLQTVNKSPLDSFDMPAGEAPWGRVPGKYWPARPEAFPDDDTLGLGTLIPPDAIRRTMDALLARGDKTAWERDALACYAKLFPQSKWLTPSQRAWLAED